MKTKAELIRSWMQNAEKDLLTADIAARIQTVVVNKIHVEAKQPDSSHAAHTVQNQTQEEER